MGQVQDLPVTKPKWELNFCRQHIEEVLYHQQVSIKTYHGLVIISKTTIICLEKIWHNCHFFRQSSHPIFLVQPKTFYLCSAEQKRPQPKQMARDHRANCQCPG